MSQPQQPPPAEGSDVGVILATTAAALALIALESRAQEQVENAIADALAVLTAFLIALLATPPLAVIAGALLISRRDVHTTLTRAVDTAREFAIADVEAAYAAAAYIAHRKATDDLAELRYKVPTTIPELGDNIDRLIDDLDAMFNQAQADLQDAIAAAYDSTTNPNLRLVNVKLAIAEIENRLTDRAAKTTTTAVHKGAADAQQAIYAEYQNHTGRPGLMKRWRTTSTNPCGMCDALNGTLVGIAGEFDPTATTDGRTVGVWRNLQSPPRHPNCRCQIELVET